MIELEIIAGETHSLADAYINETDNVETAEEFHGEWLKAEVELTQEDIFNAKYYPARYFYTNKANPPYSDRSDGEIVLKNGREDKVTSVGGQWTAEVLTYAWCDLNRDGKRDAAVALRYGADNNTRVELIAVVNKDGQAEQVGAACLASTRADDLVLEQSIPGEVQATWSAKLSPFMDIVEGYRTNLVLRPNLEPAKSYVPQAYPYVFEGKDIYIQQLGSMRYPDFGPDAVKLKVWHSGDPD